jgi:proline dehydrogenase
MCAPKAQRDMDWPAAHRLLHTPLLTCGCACPSAHAHAHAHAADMLVRQSRRFLGDAITFGVMRRSFMRQFCAGETQADIMPTINMLRQSGIRAIIDYAAEDDVAAADAPPAAAAAGSNTPQAAAAGGGQQQQQQQQQQQAAVGGAPTWQPEPSLVAVGRQYSYESEATCDRHVAIFLQAIDTGALECVLRCARMSMCPLHVAALSSTRARAVCRCGALHHAAAVAKLPDPGFAAIKVTALGNPVLLERMSGALLEIRALFSEADADGARVCVCAAGGGAVDGMQGLGSLQRVLLDACAAHANVAQAAMVCLLQA